MRLTPPFVGKMEQNWALLESDYCRIEIDEVSVDGAEDRQLESDYCRIEIPITSDSDRNRAVLESDYCRIEIVAGAPAEINLKG